jgi:TrmH family RNA methyltransferase
VPTSITSRRHPLIEQCRHLARRRTDTETVLLDGEHLILDALTAGAIIQALLVERGRHPDLVRDARSRGIVVHEVTPALMDAASPVTTSSGAVAIAAWPAADLASAFLPAPAMAIGLVDVQDPGNVGAAIRSADALGATGVIAIGETADPHGWKALRGAMGSTFRLPVVRSEMVEVIAAARAAGARVFATVARRGSTGPCWYWPATRGPASSQPRSTTLTDGSACRCAQASTRSMSRSRPP